MGVSKYNSEGYHDPVVYEALTRIEAEERAARAAGEKGRCKIDELLIYFATPLF